MNMSESIKNIAAALAKFQGEVQNSTNTTVNPFYNKKYSPLHEILNDVRPLLSKYGLSVIQSPGGDGKNITINNLLLHESGEYIEFEPLTIAAEKITAQGAGIAITYGRRYSLASILGIASEDDDDGNGLENKQGNGSQQQKKPQETKQEQPTGTNDKKASEPQVKKFKIELDKLIKLGLSELEIYEALADKLKIKFSSIKDVSVSQASDAIKLLTKWIEADEGTRTALKEYVNEKLSKKTGFE